MPVPPSNPPNPQAAIAIVIAVAAFISVVYWRIAIRVILVAVIALAVYGAVIGLHGMSSLLSAHHR
jgi:hypothetical protein